MAQVVVCLGVIWPQRQRLLVTLRRLSESALAQQHVAQIVVRLDVSRPERQRCL